jgi:hypothetical protein
MTPEVQAFLARGGRIRRFEPGDSGNPIQILEWINRQGVFAAYLGRGKAKVGRATVDLRGLFDLANEMRRAAGLEPFSTGPSKTKSHFCFTTAPRFRPAQQQAAEEAA